MSPGNTSERPTSTTVAASKPLGAAPLPWVIAATIPSSPIHTVPAKTSSSPGLTLRSAASGTTRPRRANMTTPISIGTGRENGVYDIRTVTSERSFGRRDPHHDRGALLHGVRALPGGPGLVGAH